MYFVDGVGDGSWELPEGRMSVLQRHLERNFRAATKVPGELKSEAPARSRVAQARSIHTIMEEKHGSR